MHKIIPSVMSIVPIIYIVIIFLFCVLRFSIFWDRGISKDRVLKIFTEKVLLNDVPTMIIILVKFSAKLNRPTSVVVWLCSMIYLSMPCLIQTVAKCGIKGIPHIIISLKRCSDNLLKEYKSHFLNKNNDVTAAKVKDINCPST